MWNNISCAPSLWAFAAHWTDECEFVVAKSEDLIHTPLQSRISNFDWCKSVRVCLTSCLTTCSQLDNSQEFMFSYLNPIKNAIGLGCAALFSKDAFKFSLTTMTTLRATAEAARHATITISSAPFRPCPPCPFSGTCLRVCHVTSYYSHKRWANMRRVREREWYTYTVRGKERQCGERGFPVSNYDLIYQINSSRGLAWVHSLFIWMEMYTVNNICNLLEIYWQCILKLWNRYSVLLYN